MEVVTITPMRASDVEAIGEMFVAHAAETLNVPPEQAAKLVDWSLFADSDSLLALIARDGETPVGYVIAVVKANADGAPEVVDADIYLQRAYRLGFNGVRMVRAMEDRARRAGVRRASVSVLPGRPTERLLPRLGYRVAATVFERDL